MSGLKWGVRLGIVSMLVATGSANAAPPAGTSIASIDLARAFGTHSAWRLDAVQAAPVDDPTGDNGKVPGPISLCLHRDAAGPCDPALRQKLDDRADDTIFSEPHYLDQTRIVRPHGATGQPLALIETASVHAGDGDQIVLTQALAYDAATDRFVRVYAHSTGRNNDQEVRYIDAGPLQGDFVSVEPTADAPFGFWVSVATPGATLAYTQTLHYRSATRYGDGNPLPVIESEMPNILSRLGLWRPGAALPHPAGACPKPHLVGQALWCS